MLALGGVRLAARSQLLQPILADCLQHAKARFAIALVTSFEQILIEQSRNTVQYFDPKNPIRIAYGMGRWQRKSAAKDR